MSTMKLTICARCSTPQSKTSTPINYKPNKKRTAKKLNAKHIKKRSKKLAKKEAPTKTKTESKADTSTQADAHSNNQQDNKLTAQADTRPRVFVLDFDGDVKASEVSCLRREITAILSQAQPNDEVVVRLESGGGMVHAYGLASSQLQRIKDQGINLTICVDKIAASGGYMMACVANQLLAAPFAMIGSIGVVAQLPNFHRLLKKHDIDFEQITAGKHKRTLTLFGENTEQGREKFIEDVENVHQLFKAFVIQHRPQLNVEEVATGEVWFGQHALDKALVDKLITSDEYITNACESADVFTVEYIERQSLPEKLGISVQSALEGVLTKWCDKGTRGQFYS